MPPDVIVALLYDPISSLHAIVCHSVESMRVRDWTFSVCDHTFLRHRPQWHITLLDTLRKRCDFLQRVVDQLGLSNVSITWSRAELAGQAASNRHAYHVATARAVAETRVLAEYCMPFVKVRCVCCYTNTTFGGGEMGLGG